MKISPARKAAFEILMRIEAERSFSSVLLATADDHLKQADAGLCRQLVLGVLRTQLYLDRVIDGLASAKKIDLAVRQAIRIGLFQLLFLDRIPHYSAINESVELVAAAKKRSAKGFVNGVLRNALRGLPQIEFVDEIDRISTETSHPRWLLETWIEQFGTERAFAIAAANNEPVPIAFRKTASSPPGLDLSSYSRSEFADGYLADAMNAELLQLSQSGHIYFQGEGSQLIGGLVPIDGGKFLDVCAAPGSKLTQVVANSSRPTAAVGGDLHFHRVRQMQRAAEKQNATVYCVQLNAERPLPFAEASFDTVLADVPCTGTGTIRKHPEIRYFRTASDAEQLASKQLEILKNASNAVKLGGRLIYSTCSLETIENEEVCRRFMERSPEFRLVRPDRDERLLTSDGMLRTFPGGIVGEGFFGAIFERAA